ncbi:aminopeptidase P family protein [Telmatospirillum sp.]|uniref:aminopeptidase P family protein n=1 Tax=Telmatospirillum sp. TaxID=2079197 RepID=UPI0028429B74|nr:aminopeptidase P family protein [Telmatospirillum sp.]MDR3435811.1 aminopeptidase P family protein [Telmatospirillum sp.]
MQTAKATPASIMANDRLALLRTELRRQGLDGFVVPHSDEHQGEYIPPSAERLAWLTGFTGSAGAAVVLADRAALFVDGRYTLQAARQVDTTLYQHLHLIEQPPHQWLAASLATGARVGYDPWLLTPGGVDQLQKACDKAGAQLIACAESPLDAVWTDQPTPPMAPVVPHPVAFAGKTSEQKRAELTQELAAAGLDAAVLSASESIAWLLNLRGGDVPYTPMPLSFGLLHQDGTVALFIDGGKLSPDTIGHLGNAVSVATPQDLGPALDRLAGKRVRLDKDSVPAWIRDRLRAAKAEIDLGDDPCAIPRACKNDVELNGFRQAHRRDGVALVRFFAWLSQAALDGSVTELSAADRLERFRERGEHYRGLSFSTISAAGPHAALPHYHVTQESNRKLAPGELYLVDSGGQYLDGTTDVTRTVAIGAAGDEERRRFTQVLKGHIALARCRFPKGTTGSQIDCLARLALWSDGVDFDHGTGHGVGSYLSVHEGPQRISKIPNAIVLAPGMILSDEPGYYKAGAYGIRTENLLVVRPWPGHGERETCEFETLTLAPIDLALIDRDLLNEEEAAWLNAYHARVRSDLSPLLDGPTAAWLAEATRAI